MNDDFLAHKSNGSFLTINYVEASNASSGIVFEKVNKNENIPRRLTNSKKLKVKVNKKIKLLFKL